MKDKNEVLFVICPFWGIDYPHIGVAYLSSYLRSKGIVSKILDCNIKTYQDVDDSLKRFWNMKTNFVWKNHDFFESYIDKYAKEILSFRTKIIAFSVMASNINFTLKLIEKIKKNDPNKIIITGGLESIPPKSDLISYHIVGQAEETIYKLIQSINNNKEAVKIPGLIIYKKNEIIKTPEKSSFKNINSLPFPTYEEFNLEEYCSNSLGILGSKDCINKCVFCNDWVVWKHYQFRKAEKIFEEMKYHEKNNKIHTFEFFDLLINGNLKELEKLCDMIIKSGLKVRWGGNAVIRNDMTKKLLRKMSLAGCTHLTYGLETGSDKIIKKMGKKFTAQEAAIVLKNTYENNIKAHLNLMVGFPGETEKDFRKTLIFVRNNKKYIDRVIGVATCFTIGNSTLEKQPEKFGVNTSMKNSLYKWYDKKGNNYELRMKKAEKLVSLLNNLSIPLVEVKAVYEQKPKFKDSIVKNIEEIKTNGNLLKLFSECLKEQGLLYTINHTITYIKKRVIKE